MSPRLSIAELNDMLRASFLTGTVMRTRGIMELPDDVRQRVHQSVRLFEYFTPDNDPYGEHDFGSFEDPDAGTIFWKIDYYDKALQNGSPDPQDPAVTERVLTIMLADEY